MKSKTSNILIFVASLAVLMLGGFFYGVHYMNTIFDSTTDVQADVDQAKSRLNHLQVLHDSIQNSSSTKNQILDYFVPSGGAVDFVNNFEDVARKSNLKFNTLSLDTEATPDLDSQGKELLRITFQTNGTWSNTMHFLEVIESLPYSVYIDRVDLSGSVSAPSLVGSGSIGDKAVSGDATSVKSGGNWSLFLGLKVVKIKD